MSAYRSTLRRSIERRTAVRKDSTTLRVAVRSVSRVGRRLDVDQLVGTTEIAERLGVKRHQVVHDWRRRYEDFPAPVAHLRQAMIWYWPEVERWAKATGRLK